FYARFVFFLKYIEKIRGLSVSADIFHAHDFNVSFLSAMIGTKKPIVATFGADPLFEMLYFKKKKCLSYRLFLKKRTVILLQRMMRLFISLFSRGKLVIISFNVNVNQIIKKYTLSPIINIPIGINLELFRKDKTENRGMQNNIILVIARFVSWKGIDLAVDVFRQVRKHKREARIVFIGGGPLEGYYLDKYGSLPGISFILNLDYKATVAYYKKASVLLVTSQYETLGNNITEAMAAGLPIVANDLDVFHDRLVDNFNCHLVKDNNIMDFSKRVLNLMDDGRLREEFIINASAAVADYDINKIGKRYIDLYNSLLPFC
ncbi:MAG: glycosyltransferase family 4 protein, partial [Candidatus Omnitrophica bacterium]|nr:glycosyltransferase family 4 protein [Candidatus Omnitrophota bacterium]